ncbi:MAG: elongation factor 1-beta, partial [Candidatus Nanoarchaeia archaeon]
ADIIVRLKIMPSDPSADLTKIEKACEDKIKAFGAKQIHSIAEEPVAFGLKAIIITFLLDEAKSNLDELENQLKQILNVSSAEVIDVRRAIG